MSEFPKASPGRETVLARAVNAMVRALGGASVKLRVPGAAVAGLERELGMTAPVLDEIEIGPVVVRELPSKEGRARVQVIVAATSLETVLAARGEMNAYALVKSAEQMVVGERVFRVAEVEAKRFGGVEYMFRVMATD